MRIAVWENMPSGGGKRALFYHVRGLAERGHQLETWSPPTAEDSFLSLSAYAQRHVVPLRNWDTWELSRASTIFGKFIALRRDITTKLEAMDRHCRECAEEINAGGFDVLFSSACRFFFMTPIARYVKIPTVIYLNEPNRGLYEARPRLPWAAPPTDGFPFRPAWMKRWLIDAWVTPALRVLAREEAISASAFDTILVNSYFSRESVLRAYGLDSKVCYLGIDTELFTDQQRERENVIIGLGAFVAEKNARFILDAVARVPADHRPALVWVGNLTHGGYLSELEQFAAARGVDFRPHFRIPDHELVGLLNRARAMVYAPRLEPFGLAPLEANACGLPVIAVAEGGVRETVVNGLNGWLVEADPRAMADLISRVIQDPQAAAAAGARSRQLVLENWTLDAAVERVEDRLREAQEEHRRR